MAQQRTFAKRAVAGIYSLVADAIYDRVVVSGAFRLLGGRLGELVLDQGVRAVEAANGAPILDMPVGTGFFTTKTARRHAGIVVGADIAEGMVRKARQAADEAGATNLVLVQADAHRLPFADETFANVLCHNGLPVIPGLMQTLTELQRVLARGGTLFVSVVTLPVAAGLPGDVAARVPTMLKSRTELTRALEAVGLEVTSTRRERLALLIEATKPH